MTDNISKGDFFYVIYWILDETHFKWNYAQAKKYFSSIWQAIFKYPLTPSLYKQVLILLPEKVLPHLEKPLLLTDFLMESYAIGNNR